MSFSSYDLKRKCEICGKHKGRTGSGKIINHDVCSKELQQRYLKSLKKHKRPKLMRVSCQIYVAHEIRDL